MNEIVEGAWTERAIWFRVQADEVLGVLHGADEGRNVGIIVVVGGPQYRIGSHRQFILLARAVARAGFPVLRFDNRGMGDSAGIAHDYSRMDVDIRAAVDIFTRETDVTEVVLWGLCDAASAIMAYSHTDTRIKGMILFNPWVHSRRTESVVRFKSYYLARIRGSEFWKKLFRFDLNVVDSARSVFRYLWGLLDKHSGWEENGAFVEKMLRGIRRFRGAVYIGLSGNDFTASEFREVLKNETIRGGEMAEIIDDIVLFEGANHTFSRIDWRLEVEAQTIAWVKEIGAKDERGGGKQ